MSNKQTKDPAGKNTSGGGHLGGTYYGQREDAKTSHPEKSDKARPNDGRK